MFLLLRNSSSIFKELYKIKDLAKKVSTLDGLNVVIDEYNKIRVKCWHVKHGDELLVIRTILKIKENMLSIENKNK